MISDVGCCVPYSCFYLCSLFKFLKILSDTQSMKNGKK